MSICLNSKIMTSYSREPSPSNPSDLDNIIETRHRVYGSLQEFLEKLDYELSKQNILNENPKIQPQIPPQQIPSQNNKDKKLELVESGSFLDFLLGGLSAKKNPNQAPLNNPPIPLGILRANHQHSQNPVLNFLGNCIPRNAPSNNPSKVRGNNLSELPQSARYC